MMIRRFKVGNEEWEIEATGLGTGSGSGPYGMLARVHRWHVNFRLISGANNTTLKGVVSRPDIMEVSEEELRNALSSAQRNHGDSSSEA